MRTLRLVWLGFGYALFFVVAGVMVYAVSSRSTEAQPAKLQQASVNSDEKLRKLAGHWITHYGYQCPAIYFLGDEGIHPAGAVFKVHCGRADGKGIHPNLVYRFTLRETGFATVKPW
jgi:hypothetical protein